VSFSIKPEETALLVVDMQNDYVHKDGVNAKLGSTLWKTVKENRVVENISRLVAASRAVSIPVFFVRVAYRRDLEDVVEKISDFSLKGYYNSMKDHPRAIEGTWGCEFLEGLQPEEGDYVITKKRGSAFYNTDLELLLRSSGIRTLIMTGTLTDHCVNATVSSAIDRDFNVVVVTDGTAAGAQKIQDYWMTHIYPTKAVTTTTDELLKRL
jgi:ureidoacrylate peracid hydrolase